MTRATSRRTARTTRRPKYVYSFANGKADGSSALRHLLGGKGCELAEMTNLGVSVPPGFTITAEAWAAYSAGGSKQPAGLWGQGLGAPGSPGGRGRPPPGGPGQAAPRIGALGRARVDARHDGYRPEPRAQ